MIRGGIRGESLFAAGYEMLEVQTEFQESVPKPQGASGRGVQHVETCVTADLTRRRDHEYYYVPKHNGNDHVFWPAIWSAQLFRIQSPPARHRSRNIIYIKKSSTRRMTSINSTETPDQLNSLCPLFPFAKPQFPVPIPRLSVFFGFRPYRQTVSTRPSLLLPASA